MLKKIESTTQLRRGGAKKCQSCGQTAGLGGGRGGRPFPEHFGRTGRWVGQWPYPPVLCRLPGQQQPGQALPGLARSIILTLRMKVGMVRESGVQWWLLIRETEAMA